MSVLTIIGCFLFAGEHSVPIKQGPPVQFPKKQGPSVQFPKKQGPLIEPISTEYQPVTDSTKVESEKLQTPQVTSERYEWWLVNGKWIPVLIRQTPYQMPAALPQMRYYQNSFGNGVCGPSGCR